MRYGIQDLSDSLFNGPPDIAVAGFNVGSNLFLSSLGSGTVGAATEAAKEGIPAIAFSGATGSQTAWSAPVETYMTVYANLSTTVTQAVVDSGTPYLPDNVWLNVNFPAVSDTTCTTPEAFTFVLSRIVPHWDPFKPDVNTCDNGGRLPWEERVIKTPGCYASISVGNAKTKWDANRDAQQVVLDKLGGILNCLP